MVTGASAQRSHDVYDSLGSSYVRTRREDRRIAARILAALGDARTVVNVGAGAGSYEPRDSGDSRGSGGSGGSGGGRGGYGGRY